MNSEKRQTYYLRMARVVSYIGKHLDEELELDKLAEIACFSPYHFHRIFTGMTGESVKGFIRRLRMERAAGSLIYSERPVVDIALEAGYETHESFSRAFKRKFGESPSQYRVRSRLSAALVNEEDTTSLERFILDMRKGAITVDVQIKKMSPKKVAMVHHTGPYPECGHAWESLCQWGGPKGIFGPDSEFYGVCHDDPEMTPEEQIRYDACVTVSEGTVGEGKVEIGLIFNDSYDYAVTVHKGSFISLGKTYAQLCGVWAPKSGREIAAAPSYEKHLNDPNTTPEEELLTEIYVPLK